MLYMTYLPLVEKHSSVSRTRMRSTKSRGEIRPSMALAVQARLILKSGWNQKKKHIIADKRIYVMIYSRCLLD